MFKILRKSEDVQRTLELSDYKCAEIFLMRNNQFSIQCTDCKLKSFEFEDFMVHFRNVHSTQDALCNSDVNSAPCNDDEHIMEEEIEIITILRNPMADIDYDKVFSVHNDNYSECQTHISSESDFFNKNEDVTSNAGDLVNETKKVSPSSITRGEFKCNDCNISYKLSSNLSRHMHRCHDFTEHNCSMCEAHFLSKKDLKRHEKVEHGKSYPCKHCNKTYKSKKGLKYHQSIHSDEKNFHCKFEDCGKSFTSLHHLRDHTRNAHELKRNYVCEWCGFATKRQSDLVVHRRMHTGEKPFKCDTCGKRFSSKTLLNEHASVHSQERPHLCKVCNAAFSRPKALYHHKYLHLEEKKFVCKLCSRAYAQMAGLAGHMRKHRAQQGIL